MTRLYVTDLFRYTVSHGITGGMGAEKEGECGLSDSGESSRPTPEFSKKRSAFPVGLSIYYDKNKTYGITICE